MNAIALDKVDIAYSGTRVVHDISFQASAGMDWLYQCAGHAPQPRA